LLLLSVASQSVINSNGLQPKLSGESGKGKTHIVLTVKHLLHPSQVIATSFSSKALFYDSGLNPKTVIFCDDVELPDDIEEVLRRAMTNFTGPTRHQTLDAQRKLNVLELPERLVFWLTSVDSTTSLQLINRQIDIDVDESKNQDKKVAEFQTECAKLGLSRFYEDDEVLTLRDAFLYLHKRDFKVKIPFAEFIEFNDVSNRWNQEILFDLMKAYAVLNHGSRDKDDTGFLLATIDDFNAAKDLFKSVAQHQLTKLKPREIQILQTIAENGASVTYMNWLTRQD